MTFRQRNMPQSDSISVVRPQYHVQAKFSSGRWAYFVDRESDRKKIVSVVEEPRRTLFREVTDKRLGRAGRIGITNTTSN